MDFIRIRFRDSNGLVSWGLPFGNDLTFVDREIVDRIDLNEPFRNETFTTTEGYAGATPVRIGRQWVFAIQLLDARTVAKVSHIQTAVRFAYRCEATFLNGYLIPNQTLNTLTDNSSSASLPSCIIDVGDSQIIRRVKQARGHIWKNTIPIVVRESIELTLPQSGDVVVVGGPGGIGQ